MEAILIIQPLVLDNFGLAAEQHLITPLRFTSITSAKTSGSNSFSLLIIPAALINTSIRSRELIKPKIAFPSNILTDVKRMFFLSSGITPNPIAST